MSELLLVAEYGLLKTEIRNRFECFRGDDDRLFFGTWTSFKKGDNWLGRPKGKRKYGLQEGLCTFAEYVFEMAITNENAYLRGVAVNTGAPRHILKETENAAEGILLKTFKFNVNTWNEAAYALFEAYFGRFKNDLPRGSVGDGCWGIQLNGLRICAECQLRDQRACTGKRMLKTGKNSVGFEIPIMNGTFP